MSYLKVILPCFSPLAGQLHDINADVICIILKSHGKSGGIPQDNIEEAIINSINKNIRIISNTISLNQSYLCVSSL